MKSKAIQNSCLQEVQLDLDHNFTKRSSTIKSSLPMLNYTQDIIQELPSQGKDITPIDYYFKKPEWELQKAHFDIDNENMVKSVQAPLLKALTLEHLSKHYNNHLEIYTDGSKLDNGFAGAAFNIPKYNICKSFHLGKCISIFSAELVGIHQALKYIKNTFLNPIPLVLCVDSKSVLISLQNSINKHRINLIYKIKLFCSDLIDMGFKLTFFWVPSHIDIQNNELVDKAAKEGAKNSSRSILLNTTLDLHEYKIEIEKIVKEEFSRNLRSKDYFYTIHCANYSPSINPICFWKGATNERKRLISSLMCKLRINALNTKHVKNVTCNCNSLLSIEHLVKTCNILHNTQNALLKDSSLDDILNNVLKLKLVADLLMNSKIKHLL